MFLKGLAPKVCKLQLHVDTGCIQCGSCTKVLPEFWRLVAEGSNGKYTVQVNLKTAAKLIKTQGGCPRGIIHVEHT